MVWPPLQHHCFQYLEAFISLSVLPDLCQALAGDIQIVSLIYLFCVLLCPLQVANCVMCVCCVCSLWWSCGSAQCVADVHVWAWFVHYLETVVLERQQHALEPFGCTEERLVKDGDEWLVVCFRCNLPSAIQIVVEALTCEHNTQTFFFDLRIILLCLS